VLRNRSILVAAATLLAGVAIGAAGGIYADQSYPGYVPLLTVHQAPRGDIDRSELDQALHLLQAHYYDRQIDYRQLTSGTLKGLVEGLDDPFSEYLDPTQYGSQQSFYAGRYTGIGIYVDFRGEYPVITGVLPSTPAERAGLRPDDVILKINGHDARGLKAQQASSLIQGPEGTTVSLQIQRGGSQTLDVSVRRASIRVPSVRSFMLEDRVFYIRIYSFGQDTVSDFDSQLKAGIADASGVVLDLRDNGGGYVDDAIAVISRFVDSGEAIEVRDRDGHVDRRAVGGDHYASAKPLAVLVNDNTASASEMVAGSLQAHHRAELVGEKTFGKGSIQLDYPLTNGGDLHITIQHWFLPDGRSIDKTGLTPDVSVALPNADAMYDVTAPSGGHGGDAQLNKALDVLASR
jgi:carboxyl-terminal processing protease